MKPAFIRDESTKCFLLFIRGAISAKERQLLQRFCSTVQLYIEMAVNPTWLMVRRIVEWLLRLAGLLIRSLPASEKQSSNSQIIRLR